MVSNIEMVMDVTEKQMSQPYTKREDRLYHLWNAMKQRCYSPGNPSYKYYSAKGITVCDEWLNDFYAFRQWAIDNGYDYSKTRKEQSLDRIDNQKGYSPDNCRFVSHSENCKNTDRNVWLTHNGLTLVITDWSRRLNIPVETIRGRMELTTDTKIILGKESIVRSNTGEKGISLNKHGQYVVYVNHIYRGVRRTLKSAIRLREECING